MSKLIKVLLFLCNFGGQPKPTLPSWTNFCTQKTVHFIQMSAVTWYQNGARLGWQSLMISANWASANACPNELAALERTDVHVGHYCNRSIYLIVTGRDGWSPPSGHTHANTFIAATRHGFLRTVSLQQEGSFEMTIRCMWPWQHIE